MTERGSRRSGAEGLDLHLGVYKAAGSVGRALETELREAIRSGRLHAGTRLPASRGLAADLGISRGTVVQAYAQLTAEGWLVGLAGSGTRVADRPVYGSRPTAGGGPAPSPTTVRLRPTHPADAPGLPPTASRTGPRHHHAAGRSVGGSARSRLLAAARRGRGRGADPRLRHSPVARLVPGAGCAGGSGTGKRSLSGLVC
jgi:hypothetical protein